MAAAERIRLIVAAHEVIYLAQSTNKQRSDASDQLQQIKTTPGAVELGIAIAQDDSQQFPIRKFGLSIVLYHVVNLAADDSEVMPVVPALVTLAKQIPDNAPHYYISAVAAVWTEVAKRVWLSSWETMDDALVDVWTNGQPNGQAAVLSVLESICVDAPQTDDRDIGRAINDVFAAGERNRIVVQSLGSPGWLTVLGQLLEQGRMRKRALGALRASIACLELRFVCNASIVRAVFGCVITEEGSDMRIDALDCLVDLFNRADVALDRLSSSPAELIAQVAGPDGMNVLRGLFSLVKDKVGQEDCGPEEIVLAVKLSDLLLAVGQSMSAVGGTVEGVNMADFLALVLDVVVSPRLIVSSPAMRLLRTMLIWPSVSGLMKTDHMRILLEHCASRLVRFENATDAKTNPNPLLSLLEDDIETANDRQSFLDSYRRSCSVAVEQLVCKAPADMVDVMLGLAFQVLAGDHNAGTVLYVGALTSMIDSALTGCGLIVVATEDPEGQEKVIQLRNRFRDFGREVMKLNIELVDIRKAVVSLLTAIAVSDFAGQPEFGAEVALMILNIRLPSPTMVDGAASPADKDALHMFETTCALELGHLAVEYADFFFSYYNDWYSLIDGRFQSGDSSRRQVHSFHTFLFSIVLRTTSISSETKRPKLSEMLQAVTAPWAEINGLSDGFSRSWFLSLLGLDRVLGYIDQKGFATINDWAATELDGEGKVLQERVTERVQELPLRATRYLLMASTEQFDSPSELMDLSESLWTDTMAGILPRLLPLLGQAQAFCNLDSWDVSAPTKLVLKRILTDRFWQSGISTESRDDFFARVNSSRTSFEGLASAVRGAVRSIREFSYWILYCFARLDAPFYAQPESLAVALYADASSLSCHHLLTLLSLSRHLFMTCPPERRQTFLPTMVGHLAAQLESKIRVEWAAADSRLDSDSGDLAEEMKSESILRRLSISAVSVAGELVRVEGVDPSKSGSQVGIATVVLDNIHATSPLFILFVLALGIRDSQCVNQACDALQRVCRGMFALSTNAHQARSTYTNMSATTIEELKPLFLNQIFQRAVVSYQHPNFVESQTYLLRLMSEIVKFAAAGSEAATTVMPALGKLEHLQSDGGVKLQSKFAYITDLVQTAISGPSASGAGVTKKVAEVLRELLRPVRGVRVAEWGKIERAKVKSGPLVRIPRNDRRQSGTASRVANDEETLASVRELFGA